MEKLYFLLVIAVLAFALVLWLVKIDRKRVERAKKQKAKVHHLAQLHNRHAPSSNRHVPTANRHVPTAHHGLNRTTSIPPRNAGAWESRHQRAGEELRDGHAIAAERLVSDEEGPQADQSHGLAMSAIEYVPDAAPKASHPRR